MIQERLYIGNWKNIFNMDKEKLLGWTPHIEVLIRRIYYSNNTLIEKFKNKRSVESGRVVPETTVSADKSKIFSYIESLNIKKGDILIVHSSSDEMNKVGIEPIELIKYLRSLIGEEGTLVLPAFPLFANDKEKVYNPRRTLCSTGLMPNLFIRMPGVIRSQFPWNSLAAQGPHAEKMMQNNLQTDLAHGIGSAWEYCMNNNAKILLLGVKSSHTTTMVHAAEDILDDKWPIADWYENQSIIVKNKNEEKCINIRVRKQKWVKYNASWYRSTQLKKNRLLSEIEVEGFNIGFIEDSKKMVDFIIDRTLKHKAFFSVPERCYKK